MPKISTVEEANKALLPYVPLVRQLAGQGSLLEEHDRPFMQALGDPQNKLRVVHIAGTSGKTSTTYYVAALLHASGQRVGATVSPHVDSVTERVQIDGRPMADELFCAYLSEFLDIVEQQQYKPSYFTLLYAFAFWVFEKEAVDYAVVETGLGGLLDATNTADRVDKVCVITDIGFDHMHILGNTIREIALQKIGIVHEHNAVITYRQSAEVNEVIDDWVITHHAKLLATTEAEQYLAFGRQFDADMPAFQQRNWLLAHATYKYLQERDGLVSLAEPEILATQALQVPGRMDHRQIGDKTIIMDGAHNGQKMETFLRSFQQSYPGVRPAVMLALKDGKEPADVVPLLSKLASEIIVTAFNTSQDLPAQSINPTELGQTFEAAGAINVQVEPDQVTAYQALLATSAKVCIITGSFYLLSQLRESERLA